MDSGYNRTLFMYGPWLYQDIVYVWIVVISEHCLCMNNGHIKTLYGQWLQQDIGYVWTVVISRHCLCMDSGYF
jgi:hypothetical protein